VTPHRILVTGSRDWTQTTIIHDALAAVESFLEWEGAGYDGRRFSLVSGACPTGADAIAEARAHDLGWKVELFAARWDIEGKGAGFARNRRMVESKPDMAIAFQRNGSRGTGHTIELCRKAGIPIWIWSENG
jgi:hypothetical protein